MCACLTILKYFIKFFNNVSFFGLLHPFPPRKVIDLNDNLSKSFQQYHSLIQDSLKNVLLQSNKISGVDGSFPLQSENPSTRSACASRHLNTRVLACPLSPYSTACCLSVSCQCSIGCAASSRVVQHSLHTLVLSIGVSMSVIQVALC